MDEQVLDVDFVEHLASVARQMSQRPTADHRESVGGRRFAVGG